MISAAVRFAVILTLLFIGELQSADRKCGIQITQDKILNGNVTAIDEYPWTALLRYKQPDSNNDIWGCGGTLVGTKSILTAAHCVEDMAAGPLGGIEFVRLGEYDYSKEMDCVYRGPFPDCTDPPVDIKVANVIIHPDRSAGGSYHDIAILTLEETPPYTEFIRPICLPVQTIEDPDVFYVAGWGSTVGAFQNLSSVKLDAALNPVTGTECRKYHNSVKDNLQICAGGEHSTNACKGDSGGPLMHVEDNKWTLEGIVSYGPVPCGRNDENFAPTVFTRITNYLPWIQKVLSDQ